MKFQATNCRHLSLILDFGFWILDRVGAKPHAPSLENTVFPRALAAHAVAAPHETRMRAPLSKTQLPKSKIETLVAIVTLACAVGCSPQNSAPPPEKVVIYTSIDEPFAEAILRDFTSKTGVQLDIAYDSESGKTSGFLARLNREKDAPRCDVWWSSEAFGTIELAGAGVFEVYESPAAADIPREWKDAQHRWTGLAARCRVVAFDTQRVKAEDLPQSWPEFCEARWASMTALANPQFGTTRGHVAAIFAFAGPQRGRELLQSLRDARAKLADGNSHSVRMVASGEVQLAWTDTDDALGLRAKRPTVAMVYPRIAADQPPLWIPCTVALVRGAPHAAGAKRLIDYLVSAEVERALATSDSHNVPVRAELQRELEMDDPPRPVAPDFDRITAALPEAMKTAREILLQ